MARQFISKLAACRLRCLLGWQMQEAQGLSTTTIHNHRPPTWTPGAEGDVLLQGRPHSGQIGVDRTRQNAVRGLMQASDAIVIV